MENARKDRETLKTYFQSGKVPSEAQFAALIDSVPNILEDGYLKTGEKGWIICPAKGKEPGIGFYAEEPGSSLGNPVWSITVAPDGALLLKNGQEEILLSVSQDMTFTLFKHLTVMGMVTAASFKGSTGIGPENPECLQITADRKWHDLPIEAAAGECRPGCRVYRFWACCKNMITDDYMMTEVLAQHCNYNNRKIKSSRKHWWGWSGIVCLRWKMREGKLYLQVRSKNSDLRNSIHCRIVAEWNYTEMKLDNAQL